MLEAAAAAGVRFGQRYHYGADGGGAQQGKPCVRAAVLCELCVGRKTETVGSEPCQRGLFLRGN